jgi:GNAT superfamily N-acetyltransferase
MTAGVAIDIRPIGTGDGPIVENLFGPKGACGGCWCMYWRRPRHGRAWAALKGEPNRREFLSLVAAGDVNAMLASADGNPVGWCCFGPFASFSKLVRVKPLMRDRPSDTWAIVCLYLGRGFRRQGLGTRLIEAAASEAFGRGAGIVEGYPIRPKTPARMPDAFAFTGLPRQFEAAGFKRLRRPGLRDIYAKFAL